MRALNLESTPTKRNKLKRGWSSKKRKFSDSKEFLKKIIGKMGLKILNTQKRKKSTKTSCLERKQKLPEATFKTLQFHKFDQQSKFSRCKKSEPKKLRK